MSSPIRVDTEKRILKSLCPRILLTFKVQEVLLNGKRYIVSPDTKQARKDARDRPTIIDTLEEKIKTNLKDLINNYQDSRLSKR